MIHPLLGSPVPENAKQLQSMTCMLLPSWYVSAIVIYSHMICLHEFISVFRLDASHNLLLNVLLLITIVAKCLNLNFIRPQNIYPRYRIQIVATSFELPFLPRSRGIFLSWQSLAWSHTWRYENCFVVVKATPFQAFSISWKFGSFWTGLSI